MTETAKLIPVPSPIRLDLGCGKNKREGFIGVDSRDFGQDVIHDLTQAWPWNEDAVDEVHCSHFVEHLNAQERIYFINELYRVMRPGAKATIIVPHWASCRAYGDLTHQWPPVSEFWFYYLSKEWRTENAPHNDGYTCNFSATWGYSLRQDLMMRNAEYQMYAMNNFKEAAQDLIATLVKV
jgi:Methyltransferase domain